MSVSLHSRATVYDRYAISKRFTAQETAINIVQGNISLLVSESEIKELKNGNKTMYSKLATVELNLNSITLAVSSSEYRDINGVLSAITQARSSIVVNSQQIELKVSKDNIVSSINQSAEAVSINANKINLNGVVTANQNFKILSDGSMEAKNGKFSGTFASTGNSSRVEINSGVQTFYAIIDGYKYASCVIKSGNDPRSPMDTDIEFSSKGSVYVRSRKDNGAFHENYISIEPGISTDTGEITVHQDVCFFGTIKGINTLAIDSQLHATQEVLIYKWLECKSHVRILDSLNVGTFVNVGGNLHVSGDLYVKGKKVNTW